MIIVSLVKWIILAISCFDSIFGELKAIGIVLAI